jgi:hypothetical protein
VGNLDRRIDRLEAQQRGKAWSISRLLRWIECEDTAKPTGALVARLERLPIITRGEM